MSCHRMPHPYKRCPASCIALLTLTVAIGSKTTRQVRFIHLDGQRYCDLFFRALMVN